MKRSLFLILIFTFFFAISCDDPKKTVNDEDQSGDDSEVVDDELNDDDSSEGKVDCVEDDNKVVFCGADNGGLQQMLCVDGAWEEDGDCIMRSSCDEGDTKLISCGDDDDGFQKMVCTDGSWVSDGGCDTPVECEVDEEKVVVCGDADEGLQRVICTDGSWENDGDCMIDIECEAGEERIVECGANGEKFLTLVCENGQWSEDGDCLAVSCVNGELKEVACGYNYSGIQTKICEENSWVNQGGCITGDPISGAVFVKRKTTKDSTNDVTKIEEYTYHLVDGHLLPATYKRRIPLSWSGGSWLPELYNTYNVQGELVGNTTSWYDNYIYELDEYEELEVTEIVWGEGGAKNNRIRIEPPESVFYGNMESFKALYRELDLKKGGFPGFDEERWEISFNPLTFIGKYLEADREGSMSQEWKNKTATMSREMHPKDMEYIRVQGTFPEGTFSEKYDFVNYTQESYESGSYGFEKYFVTFKKGTLYDSFPEKVECTSGGEVEPCFEDDDGGRYDNFTEVWTYDTNDNEIGYVMTAQYDADGDGTAETVTLEEKIYEDGKLISWWSKRERAFCENRYDSNFIPYTPFALSPCSNLETNGSIHYEEWSYDTDGFVTKKVGKLDKSDPAPLYEIVWNNTVTAGKLVDSTYTDHDGDTWRWTFQELGTGWTDVVLESAIDVVPATFVSHYSYLVTTDASTTTRSYRKYSSLDTASFVTWKEKKQIANNRLMEKTEKNATGDLVTVVVYDSADMFNDDTLVSRVYYAVDGTTELQRVEYHSNGDAEKVFCQGDGCLNPEFGYSSSDFILNGAVQQYWNEIIVYDAQGFETSRTITAGTDKASAVIVREYHYAYSIHHQELMTKEFLHYPNCYKNEWIWDVAGSQWIQPEADEYLEERSFDKYGDMVASKRTISYGEGEKHVLEELIAHTNETPSVYFCDYRNCNQTDESRECADFRGENNNLSPCNYSETAWSYDAEEKLTGIVYTDRADSVMRETTVAWQTVDGKAVHEKFERFYAGDTVEKKTYNAQGDIVENYFNDKQAEYEKRPRPMEFYHIKYFYDDNNGLLKEEIYGQGEIIMRWFDYLNTYSSNIAEGQELLINAVKFDNIGSVIESYDYQYDAM